MLVTPTGAYTMHSCTSHIYPFYIHQLIGFAGELILINQILAILKLQSISEAHLRSWRNIRSISRWASEVCTVYQNRKRYRPQQSTRTGTEHPTVSICWPWTSYATYMIMGRYKRIVSFIEDSQAKKHKFALGGVASPNPTDGLFIPVSIVDNPPDDSRIVREEPFGRIVPLMKWSDETEVIRRASKFSG